jgi:hypothetical protein
MGAAGASDSVFTFGFGNLLMMEDFDAVLSGRRWSFCRTRW